MERLPQYCLRRESQKRSNTHLAILLQCQWFPQELSRYLSIYLTFFLLFTESFIQGTKWRTNLYTDETGVDTFDCRVRDWYKQAKQNQIFVIITKTICKLNRYLQAAAYPKDLVVLLDSSGSMRGLRIQIARATVEKLLDTLNDDDFFNIIQVFETASHAALQALIDKSLSSVFLCFCFSIQIPRNTSIPALMGH